MARGGYRQPVDSVLRPAIATMMFSAVLCEEVTAMSVQIHACRLAPSSAQSHRSRQLAHSLNLLSRSSLGVRS